MAGRIKPYHLFEACGIELEHMIVDRTTLKVLPMADVLFAEFGDAASGDMPRENMAWRNELVNHVVELRNARPAKKLTKWRKRYLAEVQAINAALEKHNAMLLPTGAHPLMDPAKETVLWSHARTESYSLCDRIFNCSRHGWSNIQSTHLNLHYANDNEFSKLHAAVRLLLPIIPALAASSPILEGKVTGFLDARMEAYLHAQEKLPQLMGSLIPEPVYAQEDYYREILSPIAQALAPHDPTRLLDAQSMNTRGAVPRFERDVMEIRVIDSQECVGADLAIAEFLMAVLKALTSGRWVSTYLQRAWSEDDLLAIFLSTIKNADTTVVANKDYLLMFGLMKQEQMPAMKLWQHLFVELYGDLSEGARQHIAHILEHGSLASRIVKRTGKRPSQDKIRAVYTELAACLQEDRAFV
ncbi:MAG TPA: glutamate-cysteine ligase family protein [Flavobacteriales bacterium]|nr:glutamate-cysteine ligase family protein [Flavobacteriales bacterium]